jgi:hypothetical protein
MAALLLQAESLDAAGTLAALKALDLRSPGSESRTARQILLARYADLDPETALTYVDTLPRDERTESSLTIMTAWAARDPQAAAAHLEANTGSFGLTEEATASSASGIASVWAAQDAKAATLWVAGLPDELRASAVPALAGSLTTGDPAAGVAFAIALPQGSEREAAVSSVALQWAQSSPTAAAAWVTGITDPSAQASAASSLVTAWMQADPATASLWVKNLPAGASRDAAIVALTNSPAIRNDAESAVLWASSIQDPTLRASTLPDLQHRWQYQTSPLSGK